MLSIVLIMAPLTEGSQVRQVTMFWNVVEVCNRQHDVCVLTCIRIVAVGMIFNPTELATVICSLEYSLTYLLPIIWVARFVFRFNGHFQPPFFSPPTYLQS